MASTFQFKVAPKQPLVTTTPREILTTHRSLDRLVRKCAGGLVGTRKVAFDLSHVRDIDPGAVLLMMYVAGLLGRQGWSLSAYADDGSPGTVAMKKLTRNLLHLRLTSSDRHLLPRAPGDYPLRQVKDRNSMVDELEDWAQTVRSDTKARADHVAVWEMQIGEVVTNSFQHGPSTAGGVSVPPVVMLCGGLRDNTVQLAALDTGRGIPQTIGVVADEQTKMRGDGALIKYACKMGVTAQTTPQNQGYGLPHLVSSVRANGGSLHILSQRGLVHLTPKTFRTRKLARTDRRLDGTLTIVSLCV